MDKFAALIRLLIEKTAEGGLDWEESVKPGAVEVNFPNSSVRLYTRETEEEPDFVCDLINSDGRVADSFTDVDLNQAGHLFGTVSPFLAMKQLYADARRKALGADKVLDDILKELKDIIPF